MLIGVPGLVSHFLYSFVKREAGRVHLQLTCYEGINVKLRFEDPTTQAIAYELGHLVTVGKLYLYRHLLGPKGNSTHYMAKIDAGGHLALAALECKPSI